MRVQGGARGWAGEVAEATRRSWRKIVPVLLVTVVLPVLPLALVIAAGSAAGSSFSPESKGPPGELVAVLFYSPILLLLGTVCALAVARGWTGAVWAAASAASGQPAGLRDALGWSFSRSRRVWVSYLIGLAVLAGAAFLASYRAPDAPTVPDLLLLAGPAGMLAPILTFTPAPWRRISPASVAPLALVLAVVVSGEVAVSLALSWLLASPDGTGPGLEGMTGLAAAVIAGLIALPGSVLLVAATSVSYGRGPEV